MHIRSSLSSALVISGMLLVTVASAQTIRNSVLPTHSSSSKSSSSSAQSALKANIPTVESTVSPLPNCGGSSEDKALVWDSKNAKWKCVKLTSLIATPPTCTGFDTALRFDGKAWKCETIGGLLVGHARGLLELKTNKRTCDNVWGVATCTVNANATTTLKCPATTLAVETSALNSYISTATDYDDFGQEWHIYCYSKTIKVK